MHLLTISELFTGKIIRALCWTLVHSLWLGLLLAAVAAVIILCTKKSGAALRYNLLTGSLLLFSAAIAVTFYLQLNKAAEKQQLVVTITRAGVTEKNIQPVEPIAKNNTIDTTSFVAFLNKYATVIVFVWFLIIAFRLTGLISGLYDLHKIKNRQISDPGEYWNSRLQSLATQLAINKRVRLFQSGIAKIPMVMGHFKPIILFPVALLATLPQDEVEAILVHELAHIRRKDYLLNMFQHIMEIFLFFNPAVLWVSALIKTERENCCDDIAVAQTGNKRNYINALLSFQEYNMATPRFATGFTNKKYYLLQRIKRIIYNNNKTLNAMEKTFLASGLVIASLLALAFSNNETKQLQKTNTVIQSTSSTGNGKTGILTTSVADTVPAVANKLTGSTNTIVDGKRYDLKLKNNEVTELSIDGQKIAEDKFADYKTVTDKIIKQMQENMARELALSDKARISAELSRLDAERSVQLSLKEVSELAELKSQKDLTVANELQPLLLELKLKELAVVKNQQSLTLALKELDDVPLSSKPDNKLSLQKELNVVKGQQSLLLAQKEKELIELATIQKEKGIMKQDELAVVKSQLLKLNAEKSLQLSNLSELKAEKLQLLLAKEGTEKTILQLKELQEGAGVTSTEIIDELLKEKIIKSKKNLSFTLNNNELIVNDIKQPDAVHQKFKEKYVKSLTWNFNFNNRE